MMPTKRIDRVLVGVGRIAVYSGTTHAGTFKRINAMLSALHSLGDLDTLRAIKDGTFAPLVVLHAYERGQLAKLSRAASAPLIPALLKFHETHEAGVSYRSDLRTSIRHVEKEKGSGTATVASLPTILRGMKDAFRERPVAFNRLRAHLLAFASEHAGHLSPLWTEIHRVQRFKKAEGTRPRKLKRRPLTVAELDAVCKSFADHVVHGGRKGAGNKGRLTVKRTIQASDLACMAHTLAMTGMRPQEYWQRAGASWEPRVGHLWIKGTKTSAATRPTFMIGFGIRPACGEQFFRRAFATATEKALREGLDVYSLRRTFAALCESARIEPSRARAYLGHGPKTVTDLYLRTNVLPFVEQDAALVSEWIEAERKRAQRPSLEIAR
jgi:integrase